MSAHYIIFSLFAIFLAKVIKTGGNLMKVWQNKSVQFSETRCKRGAEGLEVNDVARIQKQRGRHDANTS